MAHIAINDSLTSLAAGLTPERDKAQTLSWGMPIDDRNQYLNAYRSSKLVAKIVDQIADDCFTKYREWQAESNQIEDIERLEKKLKVKDSFRRALAQARLLGEAYVYFDVQDGQSPDMPINLERVGKDSIRFITVMSSARMTPGEIEIDPLSPEYGKPRYYQIASNTAGIVNVHPSRVVVLYGSQRPDSEFIGWRGDSVLMSTMTTAKQYLGVLMNVASLTYEAKIDVITVTGLMEMVGTPEGEASVAQRYALAGLMKSNNGMLILDGGPGGDQPANEVYQQKQMSFATLPDIIKSFRTALSGDTGIPQAVLFGETSGGMGSTGNLELSSYYDRINAMQENEITPAMALFDECLIRSALGNRPEEVFYTWSPLWQMSDNDRADLSVKYATAAKLSVDAGIVPPEVITGSLVNQWAEIGVFPGIDQALDDFLANGGELGAQEEEIDDLPGDAIEEEEPETEVIADAGYVGPSIEEQTLEVLKAALAPK